MLTMSLSTDPTKRGENTVFGSIKDIILDSVEVRSVRQHNAIGLGHELPCAKHLLHHEPFAFLLQDVFVLDQVSRAKNYSFTRLIRAWEESGTGQIMVERVDDDFVENYGIADLNGEVISPFSSVKVKGLVEEPSRSKTPSNLAILGRYVLSFRVLELLEDTCPGVGGKIQLTDALDELLGSQGLNAFETDAQVFDFGNKLGFF